MAGRCGQRQPGRRAAQGRPHRQPQRLLRPPGNGGHSLAVFYYAVHSRLGPERTAVNVGEAVADAEQEERALEVEPA